MTVTHTPPLVRYVPATFPMAIQTIAALEDRIREYQGYAERGADVSFVVADCHAMIALVRETFGLWPDAPTLDPAEGSTDPIPDRLIAYWNHGA